MGVTTLICVIVGTVIALGGLYYQARSNTVTSRERAIAAVREPLDKEITKLSTRNDYLEARIDQLEDELRRRR